MAFFFFFLFFGGIHGTSGYSVTVRLSPTFRVGLLGHQHVVNVGQQGRYRLTVFIYGIGKMHIMSQSSLGGLLSMCGGERSFYVSMTQLCRSTTTLLFDLQPYATVFL